MIRSIKRIFAIVITLVVAFALATIAINVYCIMSTRGDIRTIAQIEEAGIHADTIVVLGASVKPDTTPSDILADRLEVAADLYFSGAAPTIVASGDNRSDHYNESSAMKDYLVRLGVPADDVYVDHAGYDTYASIYRTCNIYGADSAIIVTQAYHLYRAMMIGNMLGMQCFGVAADKGVYNNQVQYSVRDLFARDKDFLQALLCIPPEDVTQSITND